MYFYVGGMVNNNIYGISATEYNNNNHNNAGKKNELVVMFAFYLCYRYIHHIKFQNSFCKSSSSI